MYWINLILFSGYVGFWYAFLDNPLETFIRTSIFSYKTLSIADFIIALRFAFLYFLLNMVVRIRKQYISFKTFINSKQDTKTTTLLTQLEEDRYKIDFIIEDQPYCIVIRKTTEYDNVEGIYTHNYNDCVTNEIKPFLTFSQDMVRPRDINKIHGMQEKCLILTYKNVTHRRSVITDDEIEEKHLIEDDEDSIEDKNTKILQELEKNLLPVN